jgi:hypothetical protein
MTLGFKGGKEKVRPRGARGRRWRRRRGREGR